MRIFSACLLFAAVPWLAGSLSCRGPHGEARPNIVWIITEDHSRDDLGCYGNRVVSTPSIDRLAAEGMRFTRAFSAAPSCAPTRSGLITGMYPISIGAQHQRNDSAVLPEGVRLLPEYLREAGYFCINARWDFQRAGKTDYQFQWDREAVYDDAFDWNGRAPGQPFFAQVQIPEPHRTARPPFSRVFHADPERPIDPAEVELPPYYPDDPVARRDFAQYFEAVQVADRKVGQILAKLDADGLADSTVVFFFGDHGRPFPHGKQFLYDEGLAMPLIVRWPGKIAPGEVSDRLISMVDFAPTVLRIAGLPVPAHMHGVPFLVDNTAERESLFASRDRVDDAVDRIRCVRTKRYKYIRNFLPAQPYDMDETYMVMVHPTLAALRHWHAAGRLNEAQAKWMAESRPPEELYDLENDPWELNNVATDPKYAETLGELRARLDQWVEETGDCGQYPEPAGKLAEVRAEYQRQRTERFKAYGIKDAGELYDFWLRTLEPTGAGR